MKWMAAMVLVLALCIPAFAQEDKMVLDQETRDLCNKVVMDIFTTIRDSQSRYPELKGFNDSALSKNKYGLLQIKFENPDYVSPRKDFDYKIYVGIVGLEDKSLKDPNGQPLGFTLPVIGLKLDAFQVMRVRGRHFDFSRIIDKISSILVDHQQKYLKLKLIIEPEKSEYKVGERISFKVYLKNLTGQSLKIQPFNENTLFFTINDRIWGTQPESSPPGQFTKEEVLYPGNDVKRGFKGESFSTPGEVEIRCTYNMQYKGVLPIASTHLKILPEVK